MSRWSFNGKATKSIRSQRWTVVAALVLTFLFLIGSLPQPVRADEEYFTTNAFDVNIVTDENHVFHVTEDIQVFFNTPRHGLYRYIPDGDRYYSVRNIRVYGYNYEVYSEGGNQVVQIGDADTYVNGGQNYRITYDIVGYLDDDETKDMLSLDLLPTGWSTSIKSSDITMTLPEPVEDIAFYSGLYGNDDPEAANEFFDIDVEGNKIHAVSKETLPIHVGLTLKADLPEGYWVDPESRDKELPTMYGGLGFMGVLMLLLWLFVGRDDPIIRTVEFYPPENLDPLEVAYVGNDNVDSKDIAAQFMYFANKGYVKIESVDNEHFTMTRTGDIDPSESGHSKRVFSDLFRKHKRVELDNLPSSFGETAAKIKSHVVDSLGHRKQNFSTVSKAGRALGLAFCLIIPVAAGLCHSYLNFGQVWSAAIGLLCGILIFITMIGQVARTDAFRVRKKPVRITLGFIIMFAAIALEASTLIIDYPILAIVFVISELAAIVATIFVRRRMNNEIYGRILGFRDFIKTAEYDRLKMLSDENPQYYFNILPYAQIFGMSTKWSDKFSNIKIQQPDWYVSTYPYDPFFGHNIFIYSGHGLSNAAHGYFQAVGSEMLSGMFDSGTGGGGGFGGGGFSGGGFGGGGGGSW